MIITRQLTDTASASTASDIQLGSCVTEIGIGAFSGYTNITDVELPDALTAIGASAFANSSIRSIDIPSGVTEIENSVFRNCGSLSSCTMSSGVTNIGSNAFTNCFNLKRINSNIDGVCNLPSNLERLGNNSYNYNAFYRCNGIKRINVPDKTKILGTAAFKACQNLEECTIGSGITSIGDNIFSACTKFSKVRITAPTPPSITTTSFGYTGGSDASHYQIFVPCESYDAYTGATNWDRYKSRIVCDNMPYKVKFYYSDGSYGTLIPCDSSSGISDNDISYAWNDEYTKIEIGDCVTTIGSYAFSNRSGITEVVWDTTSSSTITTFEREVFKNLSNTRFPSILPPNTQTIHREAFKNCHFDNISVTSGMTFITDAGAGNVGYGAFDGCVINSLNYDVNTDAIATFNGATISSLTIGNSVTSIPNYTFNGIKGITALTIPSNVTSIGDFNFQISDLVVATIPSASIGACAFRLSYNLRKINIGSGATFGAFYGAVPFEGCSALTTINSDEEGIANLNVSTIVSRMFSGMGFSEIILGSNVSSIGSNAFDNCGNLQKVHIIGNSSTQLDNSFENNSNLEEVIIDNCSSFGTYYHPFRNCPKLKKITIGSGVTASNFNLSGSPALTEVIYENGSSAITNNAFSGCTSLSSITVPATVTSVGNNAFFSCNSINSISFLPNSITSLGDNCFARCSGITSIDIPSGVTSLGSGAFSGCSSANTLIIPSSVLSIGGNAFNGCSSLTSIIVGRNTPPTIGTSVFNGSNCPIYVPAASVEVYKNAQNWSVYASRIQAITT